MPGEDEHTSGSTLKALSFLSPQAFRLLSLAFSILVGKFLWNDETRGMNTSKEWGGGIILKWILEMRWRCELYEANVDCCPLFIMKSGIY